MRNDRGWRMRVGAAVGLWFWVVYGGADWLTGLRAGQGALASVEIAADAAIPFWPSAAWVYMTVTPAMILPLFVLGERSAVRALALVLAVEIALAGVVYLVWPVAPTRTPEGDLPTMIQIADLVNLTYNSVPSLHVALSMTCTMAMMAAGQWARNGALALWALGIAASTLVTHQHFIADVAAGAALAGVGALLFNRLSRRPLELEAVP
ncbi:phosphatase PAP2 family protein [Arenibacterium sp. CAU 1754]